MKKPSNKYSNKFLLLIFMGFYALCLFLTFNKHSRHNERNYHSEVWADKAGFYVYLPATIKYNWKGNEMPPTINEETGDGFTIDSRGRILTKYTYGVALLQAPFYVCANWLLSGQKHDGFHRYHYRSINIAAVTYLLLALFFLFLFLRRKISDQLSLITLGIMFFGTNLFHYAIDETGMSHVYSFFLCSFLLYAAPSSAPEKLSIKLVIAFIAACLLVLIRPTNIILVVFIFFMVQDYKVHWKNWFSYKYVFALLICATIVFLPQLIYWKYAFGSFIHYSYQGEGFNFLSPKTLHFWFSTNNGAFLYTPIILLFILSSLILAKKENPKYHYNILLFIAISFIFSSWWSWSFGCSMGSRVLIEFYPIFALPFAICLNRIGYKSTKVNYLVFAVLLVLITHNLKLSYTFDECYFGNGDWDWSYYFGLLF